MRIGLTTLLFLLTTHLLVADGIEFFHGEWEEALEAARKQEKPIFVDAYATWCGPCKRMARTVFKDKKVGDFYNQNFISLKIDMETGPGQKFMRKYPVQAFPTLYYINADGKVILNTKGARNVDQFIDLGKKALSKNDNSADYAAKYEKGDRDPELIFKYVKSLNKASKSSLKVANDYLSSQDDLDTEFNLKFILEAASEVDSRIFDLLIEKRAKVVAVTSEAEVNEKIKKACRRTLEKATEFESEELLDQAIANYKKYSPLDADQFSITSNQKYYLATRDSKKYFKASDQYIKKIARNDATLLNVEAKTIRDNFSDDKKLMSFAEKIAKKAAENGGLGNYHYTYATILLENGKKKDALTHAQQAVDKAKKLGVVTTNFEKLVYKIQQMM